jgi:hypothetical protein
VSRTDVAGSRSISSDTRLLDSRAQTVGPIAGAGVDGQLIRATRDHTRTFVRDL